jgi:hypothetical protein
MLCDQHVVKMLLESAQMLCSVFDKGTAPYKRTHYNHPCSAWVRTSASNYLWLFEHAVAMGEEFKYRYHKHHKSSLVVAWCGKNSHKLEFPHVELTDFVLAMPEIYKSNNPVQSYRNYYINEKAAFATWSKERPPPYWWTV